MADIQKIDEQAVKALSALRAAQAGKKEKVRKANDLIDGDGDDIEEAS